MGKMRQVKDGSTVRDNRTGVTGKVRVRGDQFQVRWNDEEGEDSWEPLDIFGYSLVRS